MNNEHCSLETCSDDTIQCFAIVFFFLGLGVSIFLAIAFGIETLASPWGNVVTKLHAGLFFGILSSGMLFTSLLSLFFHGFGELVSDTSSIRRSMNAPMAKASGTRRE